VDELRLGVFERKILRRINEELYCLYDEADLVTTIKITRLRWAGHVM